MHQHPILANKVSMEILNFKVVDKNRGSASFSISISATSTSSPSAVTSVSPISRSPAATQPLSST